VSRSKLVKRESPGKKEKGTFSKRIRAQGEGKIWRKREGRRTIIYLKKEKRGKRFRVKKGESNLKGVER